MTEQHGKYIWRTQGDDRVRSEHAAREGEVFDFDDPPEDGNPGEAENCRCWAEPIEEKEEAKESGTKKLSPIVPDTPAECTQKDEIAIENALDMLIKQDVEGSIEYIYYDSKGIPTIGIGTNINDKDTFVKINFLHKDTMSPLTNEEKQELYSFVQKNKPEKTNASANNQNMFKNFIISEFEQDRLAIEHLKNDLQTVKNKFSQHGIDYAEVPPSAIAGALEIVYNVGPEKFKQFNHFMDDGIKQRDYIEAYKQSHRENMKDRRYKAIEKLYDDADRELRHKQHYGSWE